MFNYQRVFHYPWQSPWIHPWPFIESPLINSIFSMQLSMLQPTISTLEKPRHRPVSMGFLTYAACQGPCPVRVGGWWMGMMRMRRMEDGSRTRRNRWREPSFRNARWFLQPSNRDWEIARFCSHPLWQSAVQQAKSAIQQAKRSIQPAKNGIQQPKKKKHIYIYIYIYSQSTVKMEIGT